MRSQIEDEAPYWATVTIPARFDIARLRPPSLPKGKRFETHADAQVLSLTHEHALRRSSTQDDIDTAEILSDCGKGHYVCGLSICPICDRRYRRWFTAEVLKIATKQRECAMTLTVYLAEFAAGQLHIADLAKLQGMLRARLRRSGFVGATLIGGTEVRYRARDRSWLVHAHLLMVGGDRDAIAQLEATFGPNQAGHAVVEDDLIDPVEQISYLQKFVTYHRPGKQKSKRKPRAYPLPEARLRELLNWMARYQFDDFRFLFGARRRGSRIREEKR